MDIPWTWNTPKDSRKITLDENIIINNKHDCSEREGGEGGGTFLN